MRHTAANETPPRLNPIRAVHWRRTHRHAPYSTPRTTTVSDRVIYRVLRFGTMYRVPSCRVVRDHGRYVAACMLRSWLEIDPVDVVVVQGEGSKREWFVRVCADPDADALRGQCTNTLSSAHKFLVHIPLAVVADMMQKMRLDDTLCTSSLVRKYSPAEQNDLIEPRQGGWLVETQTHDGTAATRSRLEQITREASRMVDEIHCHVSLPVCENEPIVDWWSVRSIAREALRLEEQERALDESEINAADSGEPAPDAQQDEQANRVDEMDGAEEEREARDTSGVYVPERFFRAAARAGRSAAAPGQEELASREGPVAMRDRPAADLAERDAAALLVETAPEMSEDENPDFSFNLTGVEVVSDDDDDDDPQSTREHLTNAEQAIKLAMTILDEIKDVPGVPENDYIGAANAMRQNFLSIMALSKRLGDDARM